MRCKLGVIRRYEVCPKGQGISDVWVSYEIIIITIKDMYMCQKDSSWAEGAKSS